MVTGGASQVAEHRTGRLANGEFFESLGGSLVHSRTTHPDMAELVAYEDDVRTFRISTSTLGSGFVESISNRTLMDIRENQPEDMQGTLVLVPVLGNGSPRIGRFGWKGQHASLESFAADAYLNEMGVTSPLLPYENSSSGRDVSAYDAVADPEDDGGVDIKAFANFMRSTKVPPRGPITAEVLAGEELFARVRCTTCHVPSITTAPAGTTINAGAFIVPPHLARR